MVRLASFPSGRPTQKKTLAESEGISADYVEQILMRLKSAGLVRSHRGMAGGFSLAKDPASITLVQVMEAAEGPISLVSCDPRECRRTSVCVTRRVWQRVGDAVRGVLSEANLAELAREMTELEPSRHPDFEI